MLEKIEAALTLVLADIKAGSDSGDVMRLTQAAVNLANAACAYKAAASK